jgi:hypothetical protein
MLGLLAQQIEELEQAIAAFIEQDPLWRELNHAFGAIKGVADRTVARPSAPTAWENASPSAGAKCGRHRAGRSSAGAPFGKLRAGSAGPDRCRIPDPHLMAQPLQQLDKLLAVAAGLHPYPCRRIQSAIKSLCLAIAVDQLVLADLSGLRILTPGPAIPTIGTPSPEYAPMGMGPTEGRRPLVVISKPYFRDPDGWKRIAKPPEEIVTLVRAAFRRDFPNVVRCKNEEVIQRDWKFPDSSLAFSSVYASNKGAYLIEVHLDAGDCGYIDDPDDPLSQPWFFVSVDGSLRRIGSFMSLLDTGDYDNDGRSELIFYLNQPEDTDGFVLFDSSLKKQASLTWTYH